MLISLLRINSLLLGIMGTTCLIPITTAFAYNETSIIPSFAIPMICSWIFLLFINLFFRNKKIELRTKTAFVVVASAWITTSLFGAIPLIISGSIPSFTDAFFESVSGFTTTGATILSDVETLPRSINLWRCTMHWLGGMGIVALTVALLPLIGVGGFQLIKAETTGPEKSKVTPKIATTAKVLWLIYLILTAVQTVLLMVFGMDFIDALSHSFATLGTGGFSTRNASIGYYNSAPIDIICTVFMFLAGINFSLYFYAISRKFSEIRDNSELKAYISIFLIAVILIAINISQTYGSFPHGLRYAFFQTASIITTTGFATADFTLWPSLSQFVLFALFFVGGCSGSTAGGIKVIRWVVLFKQVNNETKRLLHPHGVFSIRLNNRPGRHDIVYSVAAFMATYLILVTITTMFGCMAQLDLFSAFTGALSMIGNIGPAFGSLGPSCIYGSLPSLLKWWYAFAMLAGRLELYTMIIFFIPHYWKK